MNPRTAVLFFLAAAIFATFGSHAQQALWAQSINANDPPWPGMDNPTITQSARLSDGYVVCGSAKEAVFPSKNGDSIGRTNHGGFYVARYDFNGNLVWLDYGIDQHYATGSRWSSATSVTTDAYDNIYICGIFPRPDWFYYYNGADSTGISSVAGVTWFGNTPQGFIAKLNPQGVPLWHAATYGQIPQHIASVAGKGIVVGGMINLGQETRYVKGSSQILTHPASGDGQQFLYWIDSSGALQHHTYSEEYSANYLGYAGFATDGHGNTTISSTYEWYIRFHDADDTASTLIITPDNTNMSPKLYVVKYDTAGKVLWHLQEIHSESMPRAMSVAPDGSVYVSATCFMSGDSLHFVNADQTMTSFRKSDAMIYKITGDGIMDWRAPLYTWGESTLLATDTGVVFSGTRNYNPYPPGYSDTVYSANGPAYQVVHAHTPNMYLLRYDQDGNINNSRVIGDAPYYVIMNYKSLLYTTQDRYLLCGNFNSLGAWYQACTDTMYFNGSDGYMIHGSFNPGDTIGDVFDDPRVFLLSISDSLLCPGDTLIVRDSVSGDFFPGNVFKVLLSNNWGNFNNPQELAVSDIPVDSFICVLPNNIGPGNGYKLVVMSTSYNRYSADTPSVYILPAVSPTLVLNVWPGTTVNAGDTVIFSTQATATGPFPVYQWLKNGVLIPGADNDSLLIHDLAAGDIITVRLIRLESCGGDDTVTQSVTMNVLLGIHDPALTGNFRISPNPSHGQLQIQGNTSGSMPVEVTVEDMTGKRVYQEQLKSKGQSGYPAIRLPATLPTGLYLVNIRSGQYNAVVKLSLLR